MQGMRPRQTVSGDRSIMPTLESITNNVPLVRGFVDGFLSCMPHFLLFVLLGPRKLSLSLTSLIPISSLEVTKI
jgi:hypothetical protein